jgi:hypothetical protein
MLVTIGLDDLRPGDASDGAGEGDARFSPQLLPAFAEPLKDDCGGVCHSLPGKVTASIRGTKQGGGHVCILIGCIAGKRDAIGSPKLLTCVINRVGIYVVHASGPDILPH